MATERAGADWGPETANVMNKLIFPLLIGVLSSVLGHPEGTCEEFHCPENSPGCQIITPKQVKPGTCPKRCEVIRYPNGIVSRDWKIIVRKMTSSPNTEAQLRIALESRLLVSATSGFGEVFEIKSSEFFPPPGDYVILFQDPVTCNTVARSRMIVEPKLP